MEKVTIQLSDSSKESTRDVSAKILLLDALQRVSLNLTEYKNHYSSICKALFFVLESKKRIYASIPER
jgi:hypothetical protein